MSVALDLLVQFLGTACNPFVVAVGLFLPLAWPRPAAVRLGTVSVAALLGAADAFAGGVVAWGWMLVAVSGLAGAFVAEAVLALAVPAVLAGLTLVRSAVARLRRHR